MAREMIVVTYANNWVNLCEVEKEILLNVFGNLVLDIQHFGFTSIRGSCKDQKRRFIIKSPFLLSNLLILPTLQFILPALCFQSQADYLQGQQHKNFVCQMERLQVRL